MKTSKFSEATKYTLYGALFGLCFPLGSLVLLFASGQLDRARDLVELVSIAHAANPLLYVIDSAPLFLGVFARFAGVRQDAILLRFSESLEQQVRKTESLRLGLDQARKANETIARMADHDALTGLYNRHRFQDEIERWVSYCTRYQRAGALVFIDLDDLKRVNDTHGHDAGDKYLVAFAETLKRGLRSTDVVARWGGDEFAVLLPETDGRAAMEVANKLLRLFNERRIEANGHEWPISGSLGIALFPTHTTKVAELMAYADAAMYEAKQAGRNCWRLYSASPQEAERVQERIHWESRIRRALDTDQFTLLYQPLLHLESGTTRHYEALLRLEDRKGQLIAPGMFLEPAEQFGLSIAIDRTVLRKAVRRLAGVSGTTDPLRVSVNVARKTLIDPEFLASVEQTLREGDLGADRLGIEVTEAIALENLGVMRRIPPRLKELGVGLILDDFGLGFASFHYLQQFAVRMVKVQGGLIRNLLHNEENRRYIKTLAASAHDLNIEVVAKFVEDPKLLDLLRELGVDYAQGFAVGRPLESIEQIQLGEALAA